YIGIERKILNRMKTMANDGLVNLVETNERMFAEGVAAGSDSITGFVSAGAAAAGGPDKTSTTTANIKKVAGW
ncbi:hypothetical protein WDW37_21325, partial [Bdellovibrionota bacterium FG-1]